MSPTLLITVLSDDLRLGISIAIAGMSIVATALVGVSLFVAALPRILQAVARVIPEVDEPHGQRTHPESQAADDEHVIAAIGFVLHTEFQNQLRAEQSRSD